MHGIAVRPEAVSHERERRREQGKKHSAPVKKRAFKREYEAEKINGQRKNPEKWNCCDVLGKMCRHRQQQNRSAGGEAQPDQPEWPGRPANGLAWREDADGRVRIAFLSRSRG